MRRSALLLAAMPLLAVGCKDISGGKNDVLSVQFDPLPVPSVVVGDSLRDTTGALVFPHVTAFNFEGDAVLDEPVRYHAPDRGLSVDSITGLAVGDSVLSTTARLIATVGNVQAQQTLGVVPRPDTLVTAGTADTIFYSLLDTTVNISPVLSVMLLHGAAADSAVPFYLVSFKIAAAGAQMADLRNEGDVASNVDTTDATGTAGRRIRLRTSALSGISDSIIVHAYARYRGVLVRGSPVRLVVTIRPKAP